MNKQRYRLIFSKVRELLVVVADIAGAAGRSPSSCPGKAQKVSASICRLARIRFAVLLMSGCISVSVQATIIADPAAPTSQQPIITRTASGVEQVNIRTPGSGGVSRNVFSRFDVDSKGAVLNNSHADTRTSIAGMVTANPWLAGGEARIILNEINARDPSQLNGFIEVAGQQAQVVIANPAGITCSGCGFINANRATLTTGQVQLSDGYLKGYQVSQGEIIIGEGGMDSSRQDHTDLISRAVKINAALWAKDLRITTGRNQVDADHQNIISQQDAAAVRPALAIDVALLGGMYANKIKLLGTEKGVGVHNAGNIGALAGNVELTADGKIVNQGKIDSNGHLTLNSVAEVINRGAVYAAGNARVSSQKLLDNSGSLLTKGDLAVSSREALLNDSSVMAAAGSAEVTVNGLLDNRGRIAAGKGLSVSSAKLINHSAGEISADQTRITTTSTLTNQGLIDGADSRLQSGHLINQGTGRIYGDRLSITTGTLDNLSLNNSAATLAGRQRLAIGAQQINNTDHSLIYSGGDLLIGGGLNANGQAEGSAGSLINHAATVEAAGDLSLSADIIINRNAGLKTQLTVTENARHHEAVLKGEITRFNWADIDTRYKNKYGVQDAIMPDGSRNNDFYEYDYQRVVTETEVTFSDPGKILAGGNLLLSGRQLNNYDSQIISGGILTASGGLAVNNIATSGVRIVRDSGSEVHWYAKKKKRPNGSVKTTQGKKRISYLPEAVVQTIDPGISRIIGNQIATGSTATVADRLTPDSIDPVRLPESSLYRVKPDPLVGYLVETDPRFTQQKQWLGSDYMLNALKQDHNQVLKRLGDGYYEQQLLREQISQHTGQRYLNGYNNDNDQFKALMDAGITFAGQYSLVPGVALTAEQMALLTSDMVWMVRREVILADGRRQTVLTPQLYLHTTRDNPLTSAVISGKQLVMDTGQALINSGSLLAQQDLTINAASVLNRGQIAAQRLAITTRGDVVNQGGILKAGKDLQITAGDNIISRSTLAGAEDQQMIDRLAGIYLQDNDGTLQLSAGNDLQLTASQVNSAGDLVLQAGRDLLLDILTITGSEYSDFGGSNTRSLSWQQDSGSEVTSGGDLTLSAGRNLTAQAAEVIAAGQLSAVAGQDLQLLAGNTGWHLTEHSKQSSGSAISKETRESHDEIQVSQATGSLFSGHSVDLRSGQSLKVQGSSIAGDNNVSLSAGTSLILSGAAESREETHWSKLKSSGLSGTGGVGVSIGSQSLKITDTGATEGSKASMLGSIDGDLNLRAGDTLTVSGADLLAGNDLSLSASQVDILAEQTRSQQTRTVEQKQSGFTLAVSGAAGSLVSSAISGVKQATEQSSGRVAVLENMKTALSATQAVQSVRLAEASGGGVTSVIGLNLSYGSQSSRSEQTSQQVVSEGSSLAAANHLTIQATGGDINVQGSRLQAGNTLDLQAQRDVNLISAENSWQQQGRNESHGSSVGAAVTGGGFTVNASVNKGKGYENGQGVSHSETVINAGQALNISSGRDLTLKGAQASAEAVTVRVERHLTLSSEQDSDDYDMQQKNISAGASAGAGSASASYSASKDNMRSSYQSVQEQTGLIAGQGGFSINTGEHTQLNGAVISSTAAADKNSLNTGTLGFTDIQNHAEYSVSHQASGASGGVGINPGQLAAGQLVTSMASQLLSGINDSDSDSSVTGSAVSAGTLTVRDQPQQLQDPDTLSRDADNAHQTLSVIFNKEQQQERIKTAQLISEIGMQISDIVLTQGAIIATRDANDKMKNVSPEQLKTAEADWRKANPGKAPTADDISGQAYQTLYNQAFNESGFGTGGKVLQAIQAATAVVQGLAGGDLAKAVAGGSAPYLAEAIHNMTTDSSGNVNTGANLMAHAVLGAMVAQINGDSALAGAAGATTGEFIAQQLYPGVDRDKLSEDQKQTIGALATLAAGLAGGVVGDSTADAVAGAQAGENSSNNNNLGALGSYGQAAASLGISMIEAGATTEEINAVLSKNAKGDLPEGANITKVIVDGYKDGVLIAGAAYPGPAASVGNVVGGATISEIANGTYQWFDISSEKNQSLPESQQKTWDYKSSFSTGITGALAPGCGIWQNVAMAAGSAIFTDGPDVVAIGASAAGVWAGGKFGEYAPGIVNSVTGKELPGFIYDYWGAVASEFSSGLIKNVNKSTGASEEKKQ